MTRFIVASRSRADIDLPHYLGTYEFSVVPRSLFSADGELYQSKDKSSIANEIVKLVEGETRNPNEVQGVPYSMERKQLYLMEWLLQTELT